VGRAGSGAVENPKQKRHETTDGTGCHLQDEQRTPNQTTDFHPLVKSRISERLLLHSEENLTTGTCFSVILISGDSS